MSTKTARLPGAITLVDGRRSTGSPPFMVGSPPEWSDDSDGSYADLETFEHPDVSYRDYGWGVLAQTVVTAPAEKVQMFARVRYQSMAVDMEPPDARIYQPSTGRTLMAGNMGGFVGSTSPTWVDIPLAQTSSGWAQIALNALAAGTELHLRVMAPTLRHYSFRYPRTRIYEAVLVIITPNQDAPPCRIFPRDDGLGVGSGRQYPRPTSQQRGNRWVGYY